MQVAERDGGAVVSVKLGPEKGGRGSGQMSRGEGEDCGTAWHFLKRDWTERLRAIEIPSRSRFSWAETGVGEGDEERKERKTGHQWKRTGERGYSK